MRKLDSRLHENDRQKVKPEKTPAKLDLEKVSKDVIDLKEESSYEKAQASEKYNSALEDTPHTGGKEAAVSRKHSGPGARVHGVRRRTRKSKDAERISEDSEEYSSTTRFIESSLGIKSYSELAPHLARAVEHVMADIFADNPTELFITPGFIRSLHEKAFGSLFPKWAGNYRDRDVTVGKHAPPPYYEIPVLMQQYCDDAEFRISSIGVKPPIEGMLFETLAFIEGRFLSIHPFLDFNGRVARMLLFAQCYRMDLPPIALVPAENEKEEYLSALSEADKLNWQPLAQVWKKRLGGT